MNNLLCSFPFTPTAIKAQWTSIRALKRDVLVCVVVLMSMSEVRQLSIPSVLVCLEKDMSSKQAALYYICSELV